MEMTPLQMAARYGQTKVVKMLIKNNAEIDAQDKDGATAMQWAAYGGFIHTVEYRHKRP